MKQGRPHHGGGCPLVLVVRGRTGAEECPLLQVKSYYIKRVSLEDSLSIRNKIVVILYIGQHWTLTSTDPTQSQAV